MKNKIYYTFIGLIFFVGILLRVVAYSHGKPLWQDEEALAGSIIEAASPDYFFHPLKFFQKAPPLFMYATYIISNHFGIKELILRIIPFLCSLLSIPLFFLVSESFLKSKKSVIFANFLFSINYYLLYYSEEFKPYASDMFVALLLVYLSKFIDFEKFSKYQVFLYSICSIIFLLFSFPSMFAIGAIYIINFNKTKDVLKHILYVAPISIFGVFYYINLLLPLRNKELKYSIYYWNDGFISPHLASIWNVLKDNMHYIFTPGKSILLILLFVVGIFLFLKNNNERIKIYILMLILATIASILHLYPLKERMILYLIPFIIVTMSKPLDLIQGKKPIISIIIAVMYFVSFSMYTKLSYYNSFFVKTNFMWQNSRRGMEIIKDNIKPNEIILYNQASRASLYYYSYYFNFKAPNKIIEIKYKNNEKDYLKKLDELDKNKSYWLYYPYHLNKRPEAPFVKKWVEKNKLKADYFTFKKSFVAHIQPN